MSTIRTRIRYLFSRACQWLAWLAETYLAP
jgi:hypothetical protein